MNYIQITEKKHMVRNMDNSIPRDSKVQWWIEYLRSKGYVIFKPNKNKKKQNDK